MMVTVTNGPEIVGFWRDLTLLENTDDAKSLIQNFGNPWEIDFRHEWDLDVAIACAARVRGAISHDEFQLEMLGNFDHSGLTIGDFTTLQRLRLAFFWGHQIGNLKMPIVPKARP